MSDSNLNPSITDTMIGIRELKKITIYPLSLADEFKMTELIATVVSEVASADDSEDGVLLLKIITAVKNNIKELLQYVLEPGTPVDEILHDITNDQVMEIATIIFEVNYANSIKNFKDLIKKAKPAKDLLMRS